MNRIIIAIIVLPQAFGQTAPSKSAPKQVPTQSIYLAKPVPLSVETVGPGFKGHDIVSLVTELKRTPMGAHKSEFETTAQYEQRIKSLLESKNRQYVFALDEFAAAANYDADKQVMNIGVTAPFVVGVYDYDSDTGRIADPAGDSSYFSSGFALRSILRATTQFVATNAFGVKATVTSSTYDEFGVIISKNDTMFADIGPCCDHAGTRKADLSIEMDVQTARAIKPFIRVALICTLVSAIVYEGTDGRTATISSPREVKTNQRYVLVHPDELWIDQRTGRILEKFVPG